MAANDDGMQDQMAAANPVTREQVVSMAELQAEGMRIKREKERLFPELRDIAHEAAINVGWARLVLVAPVCPGLNELLLKSLARYSDVADAATKLIEAEQCMLRG